MSHTRKLFQKVTSQHLWIGAFLILLAVLSYVSYLLYTTVKELNGVRSDFASSTAQKEKKIQELQETLTALQNQNASTTADLVAEQNKNTLFSAQIQAIGNTVGALGGTVGTLEKLSKTDKELLQKYSKVYFLNENYIPSNLTPIPTEYLFDQKKLSQLHTNALPFLAKLVAGAARDGISLEIISAYRSFYEQESLKTSYKVTYGEGANKFSADQGYSEHQLGTAIDFTTAKLGVNFSKFETDPAYKWMNENAYKYGFILSYPEGNSYYQFEPWHWRFVGIALAAKLHAEGKHFYDLDQRQIASYLVSIFD